MYLGVKKVTALSDFMLLLVFENGEKRIFDVKPYLLYGKFTELRDEKLFKTVQVKFDTVEWSNQLDLDPELLYKMSIEAEKTNA